MKMDAYRQTQKTKPINMTTDQLHQKHLQAIINDAEPHEEIPALIVSKQKTAKQCALITLEHTIGVLSNLYKKSSAGNVFVDILNEMDELIKQKEELQ